MSNLINHAKIELEIADAGQSLYGKDLPNAVIELITVFLKQNHSGGSAACVLALFEKLARFKPLAPLTGEDKEWCEVSKGVFQNKRCSSVFKDTDGRAYYLDAVIFRNKEGITYTNSDSRRFIEFPYTPKSEVVDVDENQNNLF